MLKKVRTFLVDNQVGRKAVIVGGSLLGAALATVVANRLDQDTEEVDFVIVEETIIPAEEESDTSE